MAYKANIPQPGDQKNVSQGDILNNFTEIKTVIDINHVTFADADGNQGKHKYVTFPEQGTAITDAPKTEANEVALYCRQIATGGTDHSALFFRPEDQAAGAGLEYDFTTVEHTGALGKGHTYLPGGLILNWGYSDIAVGGSDVLFNKNFATAASVYSVQVTQLVTGVFQDFINISVITDSQFHVNGYTKEGAQEAVKIYFIAIGI